MRYIAHGMLDYSMVIPVGAGWVRVEFKGGRSSGYGNYSASYTTDDKVMQAIIEGSPDFQSGKIKRDSDFEREERRYGSGTTHR